MELAGKREGTQAWVGPAEKFLQKGRQRNLGMGGYGFASASKAA